MPMILLVYKESYFNTDDLDYYLHGVYVIRKHILTLMILIIIFLVFMFLYYRILKTYWIALKFLQEFPDAVFLAIDVESLLGEAEVSSLETRVPVRKGRNF